MLLLGVLAAQAEAAAPAGVAAYDLIDTASITVDTASVTFTSGGVWADYRHLILRIVANSDRASSNSSSIQMTFNNVTTATYNWQYFGGFGTSVFAGGLAGRSAAEIDRYGGATTPTYEYGQMIVTIAEINNTNKWKTVKNYGAIVRDTTPCQINLDSNLLANTAAITEIDLVDGSGANFIAGSEINLYGLKG